MGTLKEYKGRADFSRNFFEVGGFSVKYPNGFATPSDAIAEAVKSESKVVVLCSTDENYTKLVQEIVPKLKENKLTVILAGYPKERIEEYRNTGVDEFIYLGADAYSILKRLLNSYEL
jgi:methylmalonyl-CoA mutase